MESKGFRARLNLIFSTLESFFNKGFRARLNLIFSTLESFFNKLFVNIIKANNPTRKRIHSKQVQDSFMTMYIFTSNFCQFNPFPNTTNLPADGFEHVLPKNRNLYNWMDNLWLKVENIVAKGKIARFVQFSSFVTMFSNSRLLQRRQKVSIWGKGLILSRIQQISSREGFES